MPSQPVRSPLGALPKTSMCGPRGRIGTGRAARAREVDRWDEATGENLIERIAGVSDYLVALESDPGGGEALAGCQDHAAQPGGSLRSRGRTSRSTAA